ncbi:MAG TPA: class I SAM-dependent methyltransferase [Candidatus Polarisedimenticolaceae bacterium]|nr:class I SAM-dependent methyltransferase [Candidatus Polarisedimenticolaceae bacterium]
MSENPIRSVSDTALWVAIYRAMESDRPDAIFKDPHARRLAGERGEAIVERLPKGRKLAWPMIVRTAVMDEIILRLTRDGGVRTVVNLAAGLDTRPYRLPLPPAVRWLHVDFPDMVAYVRDALRQETPVCALEYVPADLREPAERAAVFDRADAAGGTALAVAEGLLIYLKPEQVDALGRDLAARRSFRYWLIDLASPDMLRMLRKTWEPHLAAGNAPMLFAPAEGTGFFNASGWREAEYRSIWTEALRLKRTMKGAWLFNLLSRLMPASRRAAMARMSGMVLLERAAQGSDGVP